MAMSLSRPDPSSPSSIADATFGTSRRGFDQHEVKDFLRMVAAEFGRLRERERFLERELTSAQEGGVGAGPVDEEMLTRQLGEEAVRILTTARESANEIREKAEQAAARLLSEASDDAARVREEADIEASRQRADAAADAEAELSMAKQQGREMVNEARAYRERVLSELARRRELAREQIEQLIHGRDRLTQAFERARLVAVDVVAEMQPLGEPDEYVNLTPTTGPLPVMIANSARPADAEDAPETVDSDTPDRSGDAADASASDQTGGLRIIGDDELPAAEAEAEAEADVDGASQDDDGSTTEDADTVAVEDTVDAPVEVEHTDDTSAETQADDANADLDDDAEVSDDDGDVVVDLFARLRADAADPDEAAAESDAEDDDTDTEGDTTNDTTNDTESGTADADLGDVAELADDAAHDADDEADEPTAFELRDEVLTPLIVASAKKLKRALADEQNDVLDALRRSDAVNNLDALLPWVSEHSVRFTDAVADDLLEAVHLGSATSRTINRKIRKALATEAVGVANDRLEEWLIVPLRDRLERCIVDGEGDNAVVTKKVRAVYREWKTQHIDETLDDILRCAYGRGVLAGFDLDTPIVWVIDERSPACPDCHDNALAGAVAAGAQFPTGDSFAPAHQGCRCLLTAADR